MSAEFDAYADDYAATVERSIAFSGLRHDYFVEAKANLLRDVFRAHFEEAPSVLDVGCGVGSLHRALSPFVSRLSGCDVSPEALTRARTRHPDVHYELSRDDALPFADRSHDVALAVCVFHHVPPAQRPALARNMARVVKPGGLVMLIEHNPFNPGTRLAVSRCPFDRDAALLAAPSARRLLREAGADAVESRHFLLLPSAAEPARRIEHGLRRLPLGAQYVAFGRVG